MTNSLTPSQLEKLAVLAGGRDATNDIHAWYFEGHTIIAKTSWKPHDENTPVWQLLAVLDGVRSSNYRWKILPVN